MTKYNLLNANEIQSAVRIKYQSNHETKKLNRDMRMTRIQSLKKSKLDMLMVRIQSLKK